ncbi:MAG: 50S ribosomal protein L1 [Candidatus Moraniibacteriota bacterium]|nr:MAG: 50S ribosomal protein L1 [Candidatus Moranbacteria bacterium]
MKYGKNYRAIAEKREAGKLYDIKEAVSILKENRAAQFDETVEIHFHLGIDPKKTDQLVRGTTIFPNSLGRAKRIAVVTGSKSSEAKEAGADLVGGEELIAEIKEGKCSPGVHFDILLATPDIMPKLATVAKILGPKGMMPNPKNETVTSKVKDTVLALKKGSKASFKTDDSGNIHQSVGKISMPEKELTENIHSFIDTVQRLKPESMKGRLIVSATLATTMGPGFRLSL